MRMPRDLSAQGLTELLKIYGYQITRQTRSHLRLTDLPPLIVPLAKLESTERWPREQVVCSLRHSAVLPGCIPCATVQ